MKTKKINLWVLLAVSTLFAACHTPHNLLYTTIDVLRPAEVIFPTNVNSLLLANNCVTQPENVGHSVSLLNDDTKSVSIRTDSLPMFLLSALNEELGNKGFFADNYLMINTLNAGKDFSKISPLAVSQVKNLAEPTGADAVLALNKLEVVDLLSEGYNMYSEEYVLGLDVVYNSYWTLQFADNQRTQVFIFRDTVYWEASSYNRHQLIDNFPDRYDALVDGALYVGQKMINRLVPYWEENDRYLFDINSSLMQQGMDFVHARDWTGAIPLWQNALEQTDKAKDKALIQSNIAVAQEITGNLDDALISITQAIENYGKGNKKELNTMLDCKEQLVARLKQQKLLREQIGE
ncbi:MAG: tetratricopeptide repeat protein [Prevotellaceae bacterium]|jgi:hypothetical protein|nr:tetratricopeptide repeat protein [Prevotellaceae bacterium]